MNSGSALKRVPFSNRGTGFKPKNVVGKFTTFSQKKGSSAYGKSANSSEKDSNFSKRLAADRRAQAEEKRRADTLAAREAKPLPTPIPMESRGTYAKVDSQSPAPAIAKDPRQRNPHLLALSNGASCTLFAPLVGMHDPSTVVAAHANWKEYGKAKSKKAHDFFSVSACHTCHTWLDQESGDPEQKKVTFEAAMVLQILVWQGLAAQISAKPARRKAAQWALDGLAAHPLGRVFLERAAAEAAET